MKEFIIQGQLKRATKTNNTCPDNNYVSVGAGLRVEVWDRDARFNDRLGAGTTLGASTTTDDPLDGYFEIQFTDEAFRQEPGETELEAALFFQVFRQRQLLFSTSDDLIALTEEQIITQLPPSLGYPADDGNCYRIEKLNVSIIDIPEEEERPIVTVMPPNEDKVVDILPTSDQIYGLGKHTSVTTTNGNGGSLQQIVDGALGQVLGQNFKMSNANAFRDSLNQVFTQQESNGTATYTWNPRSYTTQMELGGAITGAQASLYHRAKAALKEILPLLDGLYELDPSSDKQNREAVRSIVRTEIIELVNEMGVEQGPRVQRVDSLFQLLIGSEAESRLPEQTGGQIKGLAEAFGLVRSRINTVDEERNYGNFLIIRDYIVSLRQSWNDYVSIQRAGGGVFVGTQLVLLSQALSVMGESVQETYRIMDLVFLGPEERQSIWIDFNKAIDPKLPIPTKPSDPAFPLPDGTGYPLADTRQLVPSMDLERLLSWAMRFATEEGPTLARSGGKLGIANVLAETAETLMILLQAASFVPVGNSAFRRAGVKRALQDLAFQTFQVKRLAQELIPPSTSGQPDDVGDSPLMVGGTGNSSLPGGITF